MNQKKYLIRAKWGSRVCTFAEVAAKLSNYLATLRAIHPLYSGWQLMAKSSFVVLPDDEQERKLSLATAAKPGSKDRPLFLNLDAKSNIVDATVARNGFLFSLYSTAPGSSGKTLVRLEISAGSGTGNMLLITIPSGEDALIEPGLIRRLMLATISSWEADIAIVFSPDFTSAIHANGARSPSKLQAGWLSYIRNGPLASSIRSDWPCKVELLPDAGVLFTLSEHAPDPDNAADIDAGCRLQARLDSLHFDHDFMVFGWPRDDAEVDYAHQVTGAPPGMGYVVGFAAFDGYDAQRKVLLIARLFRLAPSWGTDLHPIYRERPERLETLPYVVQARLQIAAVAYAGASTPIEWHVGIETNAAALKTLLNDWSGIPETQLRVVHTPFEGDLRVLDGSTPAIECNVTVPAPSISIKS